MVKPSQMSRNLSTIKICGWKTEEVKMPASVDGPQILISLLDVRWSVGTWVMGFKVDKVCVVFAEFYYILSSLNIYYVFKKVSI